jgi:nudix-type nucleoside diphosphatase (YffH/AdpP family)
VAELVEVQELYRGWARFCLIKVRLEDGQVLTRSVEDHGASACVLPYDPERRTAILVRQFRPGVALAGGREGYEPPAGIIDPGESGLDCARREAEEETGLVLKALEPVGRFWSSPGSTTETADLFLAPYSPADRTGPGGGVDEHENVEVLEVPLAELVRELEGEGTFDLKLMTLVQTLRLRRPELFA